MGAPETGLRGFITKKRLITAALIVIVLGIAVFVATRSSRVKVTDLAPTTKQQETAQSSYAQANLKQKNYQAAVEGYIGVSTDAFYLKEYDKAEAALQDCIKNVPDADVPYYVYSSLATIAQKQGDTSLEKSSLQTAIKKAQLPGSGATAENISVLQKMEASLE